MKFKYYMRGFGAGLIAATIILMIAGKVDDNNKSLSADKKQTDSTGSVIAFTTESSTEDKSQSETEEQTETQKQENTSTKEIIISETKATHVAEENTTQRPTVRITTGDGSGETELILCIQQDMIKKCAMAHTDLNLEIHMRQLPKQLLRQNKKTLAIYCMY